MIVAACPGMSEELASSTIFSSQASDDAPGAPGTVAEGCTDAGGVSAGASAGVESPSSEHALCPACS